LVLGLLPLSLLVLRYKFAAMFVVFFLPLEQTTKCDIHYCGTEVRDSNAQRLYSAHRFRSGRRRVIRSSFLLFPNGKTGTLFARSRAHRLLVWVSRLGWGESWFFRFSGGERTKVEKKA